MQRLTVIFLLLGSPALAQQESGGEPRYHWEYIKPVIKKSRSASLGTRQLVNEIQQRYQGLEQQRELIRLYGDAYDYKIVDKTFLDQIIDSLVDHGSTDDVRRHAAEQRRLIRYRFLGKEIKELSFPAVDGKNIRLSDLPQKMRVIELWATWCAPCIEEMKKIPTIRADFPDVEFYSISLDKSFEKMVKFVGKHQYPWPIVFGGDEKANKSLWDYFNIVAIPKYYIIDSKGIVIDVADHLDENRIKKILHENLFPEEKDQ